MERPSRHAVMCNDWCRLSILWLELITSIKTKSYFKAGKLLPTSRMPSSKEKWIRDWQMQNLIQETPRKLSICTWKITYICEKHEQIIKDEKLKKRKNAILKPPVSGRKTEPECLATEAKSFSDCLHFCHCKEVVATWGWHGGGRAEFLSLGMMASPGMALMGGKHCTTNCSITKQAEKQHCCSEYLHYWLSRGNVSSFPVWMNPIELIFSYKEFSPSKSQSLAQKINGTFSLSKQRKCYFFGI